MIKSLKDFINGKDKIYCYGMGDWGRRIGKYCIKHHIKFDAYLTTEDNNIQLFSKPSYIISNASLNENDGIIIATTNEKYIKEMLDKLKEKSIKSDNIYIPFQHSDFRDKMVKIRHKIRRKKSIKLKKRNIFDFLTISSKQRLYFFDLYDNLVMNRIDETNIVYGHDVIVKRKFHITNKDIIYSTILHATHLDSNFTKRELNPPNKNIYCMSDINIPQSLHKENNIYAMGPYIRYVKPIISYKQIMKIKYKLGKTLLVVPSHVIFGKNGIAFSQNDFIKEINRIKNEYNFNTVLVCLHYDNIRIIYPFYKAQGYKIMTAGNAFDMYFLMRLRTIIDIADITMGNDADSTFLGYSISLNKPYYYFNSDINYTDAQKANLEAGYSVIDEHRIYFDEIKKLFGTYNERINDDQVKFVEKYWGTWNKKRKYRDFI